MNAPPDRQLRLLDLQDVDSDLDRLAHRRRVLPELAEIERLEGQAGRLADDVVRAETTDSDLAGEQRRLEDDVDLVRARAERDRQRLDAGAVSTPREIDTLQSELASLHRRQDTLEEQVLDLMEQREAMQGELAKHLAERSQVEQELGAATGRRATSYAEIDAAAEARREQRAGLAAEIPAELLALYEKVRADRGGVGAAALHRGRCEGCHLSLAGSDLAGMRAAPPELVIRCEECRRILVRTPGSGL